MLSKCRLDNICPNPALSPLLCSWSDICFALLSVVLLSFAKTGTTALINASGNGHKDIVRMLLESKANVNAANNDGAFGDILERIQADLLFI